MKEYLTTNELSLQIKMAPGTIRNLVYKGIFVNGVHYIKPTPRKLLFIGSAIEAWLYGKPTDNPVQGNSLINI